MKKALLFFVLLLIVIHSIAEIRLPSIIGSNMVLQQKSADLLWGWCDPAEKIYITTSWDNHTDSVTGTRDAKWSVTVTAPTAGGPYSITLKGSITIVLQNVMIGEVWVCSGQSNMEFHSFYAGSKDIQPELKNGANNNIHLFLESRNTSNYPQDDCHAQWTVTDSSTLKHFSEVAYFFAKKLNKELNVPVGLVEAAWGGTPAETWTPQAIVNNDPLLAISAQKQKPSNWWPYGPGYTYNAMIAPLTNYNIQGAIWYQGEGNTDAPETYSRLFSAMIESWRSAWHKEFPFYYVQIAPFTYGNNYTGSAVREQQAKTMALSNTGMVVVSDLVDDTTNIHPWNKHTVGERLANWALVKTYSKNGVSYASPMFDSMQIKNNKAVIAFRYADDGLTMKGNTAKELYIAGNDGTFYPAEAKIEGSKLIVWSDKVKQPAAVRYEFSNAGIGNLTAKNGLPVAPFRTDDWNLNK